jgi:beta-phosphoglucomutase-like phosphatase (HAD superfamily)
MTFEGLPLANGLALILDLDGVVVDSMPVHTLAWQRYLQRMGIVGEDFAAMQGRRNDQIIRDLLGPHASMQEVFEHGAAKERLYRELMAPQLQRRLVPGVARFLERAGRSTPPEKAGLPERQLGPGLCGETFPRQERAAPVALATNAEPANADFVLDGTGLRRWFQAIADGSQVERPKPAPDIYLFAAELLGIEPRNCIVFEDSPVGIAAARAAGMRVVGLKCTAQAPPPNGTSQSAELPGHELCADGAEPECGPKGSDGTSCFDAVFFVQDFLDPALEPWLARQRPC